MTAKMKKRCFSFVSVALLVTILTFTAIITVSADEEVNYSFYSLSSSAATYMNKELSPSNENSPSFTFDNDGEHTSGFKAGNAGIYLGYCDVEQDGGFVWGWLMSALSSSSSTYAYDSFSGNNDLMTLYRYTQYGYLLNELGLDSTATEGFDFVRFLGGALMMLAYLGSVSVTGLFQVAFTLLKWFNPFQLFAGIPTVASFMGITHNEDGIFASVIDTVSSWYNAITDLSWFVIIPLFVVFLVLTLLLSRVANKADKVKKFLIRIIFIAVGIPICGALYTGCLNSMEEMTASGSTAATKIIASTFVDFGSWVDNSQLAVPSNAVLRLNTNSYTSGSGRVSNASYTSLRKTCMYINAASNAIDGFDTVNITGMASNSLSYDTLGDATGTFSSSNGVDDVFNILGRYMFNDFYHASDWESSKKTKLSFSRGPDTKNEYQAWFNSLSNTDGWDDDGNMTSSIASELLFDGSLVWTGGEHGEPGHYASTGDKGLSTLAMYNYLSSKFTPTSVVVYSNEKSSSGFVRESHHSVNLIGGSGLLSFLYYMNALTLLFAYTVIGWFYAIAMCFTNLRRGLKAIGSTPFALMGSIPAIAKTLTYVAMLIVEIIGTFFVYSLVSELLFSLTNALEGILSSTFNSIGVATITLNNTENSILSGVIFMQILLIVQIILVIIFTILALRLRKSIVKALDEVVGGFIDNLLNSTPPPAPPKQPGMLSKGAGALAAGSAMGVGQRLGSNLMSKNAAGSSSPQGTQKGADGGNSDGGIGDAGGTSDVSVNNNPSLGNGSAGPDGAQGLSANSSGSAGDMSGGAVGGDMSSAGLGQATDSMFAENNQEQADKTEGERVQQMSSLGGDTAEEKEEEQNIKDAKAERDVDAMTGQTTAMDDEQYDEDKREAKREAQKEAATKTVKAAAQTAVGVGEVVAGGTTGNAGMVQDGAKNTMNGMSGMADAKKDMQHADTNAEATAMQREQDRNDVKVAQGDSSSGSNVQSVVNNDSNINNSSDNGVNNNTANVSADNLDNSSMGVDGNTNSNMQIDSVDSSSDNKMSNVNNSSSSSSSRANTRVNAVKNNNSGDSNKKSAVNEGKQARTTVADKQKRGQVTQQRHNAKHQQEVNKHRQSSGSQRTGKHTAINDNQQQNNIHNKTGNSGQRQVVSGQNKVLNNKNVSNQTQQKSDYQVNKNSRDNSNVATKKVLSTKEPADGDNLF